MTTKPTAAPLPLLCDAASNTVTDWPLRGPQNYQFPPCATSLTGPGSSYAVARAALEALKAAHAEAALDDISSKAPEGDREKRRSDSCGCSQSSTVVVTAGAVTPPAQAAAVVHGVSSSRVTRGDTPGDAPCSDDECEALYRKYGLLQSENIE